MRSGMAVAASPEIPLFQFDPRQMAKFYNVPALGVGLTRTPRSRRPGGPTSRMHTGMAAALSGPTFSSGSASWTQQHDVAQRDGHRGGDRPMVKRIREECGERPRR